MDQEKIGKFIAEKRKLKDITQKKFAEMLNVTDKTVSRWENGHYLPDVSLFKKICEILDIEVVELLNGENNVKKGEVEKTIMNIIDLSDKDKKRKINKVLRISGLVICLLIIMFGVIYSVNRIRLNELQKILDNYQAGEKKLVYFPYRYSFKEMGNGWVCSFYIEYSYDNLDNAHYYGYDCDNLKYQYLKGFNYLPTNGEDPVDSWFYSYEPSSDHPSLMNNSEYLNDLLSISDFFEDKKFKKEITLDDLKKLKLNNIKKEDIVELFNKTISSEIVTEAGKYDQIDYSHLTESRIRKSTKWFGSEKDYKFLLGYLVRGGNIYYVNIDLMIDDVYLSDIVNDGKANEDQLSLYNEMKEIEKRIVDDQSFKEAMQQYTHPALGALQDNLYMIEEDQKGNYPYSYAW